VAAGHSRLAGARAHARQAGIISAEDLADIQRGMAQIVSEIEAGTFEWSLDLEDVHLNIEKRLTALVGDAGKRLHTGRSRNDQVATDIRLYLRDSIDDIQVMLKQFQTPCSTSPNAKPRRRCPASPTCRSRSRSPSATTCWPGSR
jgi:argininosuccinate lyase